MKIDGTYQIPAPPERVWTVLMDPAFIQKTIPGCDELVPEGESAYHIVVKAGLGAIRSTFTGQVRLEELQPPQHYRMVTSAKGTAGFVEGVGIIDLTPKDGGTEVHYQGDVQVGGMMAAIGSRMIEAAFRKSVNDFFAAVAAAC